MVYPVLECIVEMRVDNGLLFNLSAARPMLCARVGEIPLIGCLFLIMFMTCWMFMPILWLGLVEIAAQKGIAWKNITV